MNSAHCRGMANHTDCVLCKKNLSIDEGDMERT